MMGHRSLSFPPILDEEQLLYHVLLGTGPDIWPRPQQVVPGLPRQTWVQTQAWTLLCLVTSVRQLPRFLLVCSSESLSGAVQLGSS